MNIRTKLAIRFTIIVATLAFLFSAAVYYFSAVYRFQEFYGRLEEKANNYAQLMSEFGNVSPDLIKVIDKNTAYLPKERIVVLNNGGKQLFNTFDDNHAIEPDLIRKIKTEKKLSYNDGINEVFAMLYRVKEQNLLVVVSAYDEEGFNKLNNLKLILITGLTLFIFATLILGWLFARQALNPISKVVSQVEKITASNLALRVNQGNGKDEIAQLAVTFNSMLNRIQEAFEIQKGFVSNSSHELRTPLTSITGQLEVALMNDRSPLEYKAVLSSLLEDITNVNKLINGLLELTQADLDISKLRMKKIRIDELLFISRSDLLKRRNDYKINFDLSEFPEDEEKLVVYGSEYLLRSVFINIMDNSCKFSGNKTVDIKFTAGKEGIDICFSDSGIGIPANDVSKIGQAFYRGSNTKGIPGHGLGMSLTSKVIEVHEARIKITSVQNEFTSVRLSFNYFLNGNNK